MTLSRLQELSKQLRSRLNLPQDWADNARARQLQDTYEIGDGSYKRIYYYHIRKTGGTSINHMFLGLAGTDGKEIYQELGKQPRFRLIKNDKVFVGWNKPLIEQGNYFYAFSHLPSHALQIPNDTYTFTWLRDPVKRVISHYKMLVEEQRKHSGHAMLQREGSWVGNSFSDFLDRVPKTDLLNQLYMFSSSYSVTEAAEKINACQFVGFLENGEADVNAFSENINLPIVARHSRKTKVEVEIAESDKERLREMLEPEYQLFDAIKR